MKKIFLTTIAVFTYFLNNAQITSVELILISDTLNLSRNESSPIEISSDGNYTLSGVFDSETSILIKASLEKSIKLIPKDPFFSPSNLGVLIDPPVSAVRIKSPGGIKPPISRTTIKFYPNPVQTELNFTLTDKLVNYYTISNQMGVQKIAQSISPTNTATINVSNLTSGIYFLKLNLDSGKQLSIQFIKN